MPLDPSIISGVQPIDFGSALTGGATMAGLAQQRKIQGLELQQKQRAYNESEAIKNATNKNTTIGPNGSVQQDTQGIMSDLAGTGYSHLVPQVAQDAAQRQMTTQKLQLEQTQQKLDAGAKLLAPMLSMNPQDPQTQKYYDSVMPQIKALGLPMNDFTPQVDLGIVKSHVMQAMSGKDQIDTMLKQQEAGNKGQELRNQTAELGLKVTKDKAEQNQQTLQGLQALRGNPALQRAETNVLAAKNINDLADQTIDPKTGKRNLNTMNPQAIDLFNHELVRVATGGTGNESDLEHLSPGTPQFKLAQLHQRITGAKTPAEASAYIQQGLDYVNTLSKSSNQFLYQNAKHVVEAKRNYLAPQDQKQYDAWLEKMKTGEAFFGDMPGGDGGGQTQASKSSISTATQHPQASAALQWAKQNPTDPRAAKIMQRLGQTVGQK